MNPVNYCLFFSIFFCSLFLLLTQVGSDAVDTSVVTYNGFVTSILEPPRFVSIPTSVADLQHAPTPNGQKLQFFGDILLGRNVERLMQKNGLMYPLLYLPEIIGTSKYVFANFEASVPSVHIPTPDMMTKFSVDASHLELLQSSGITHVTLANNHSFDYGHNGFKNTSHSLLAAHVVPFGNPNEVSSSSVTYVTIDGYSVAIIALNAVFFNPDQYELEAVMAESAKQSDIQIVYVHWGTEYQTTHSIKQEVFAKQLVALGVDAIIGHHPHVVQDIQLLSGVPVFYSLGNFIFDQYFSAAVQTELSVAVQYIDRQLVFSLIPLTSITTRSQPNMMDKVAAADLLKNLAVRSDSTLAENIKQGKVIVPFTLATSSKTSMILK